VPFSGYFNGNGHSITDLTRSLFGYIKPKDIPDTDNPPVTVERLHIEIPAAGVTFPSSSGGGILASVIEGGTVQYVSAGGGEIRNTAVSGIFIYQLIAGAVLRRCYSTLTANGTYNIGLLVTDLSDSKIEDCYTTGTVKSNGSGIASIAGIAAWLNSYSDNKIYNTYATGEMIGYEKGSYGGGIAAIGMQSPTDELGEIKNNVSLVKAVHIAGRYPNPVYEPISAAAAKSGVARVASIEYPGYSHGITELENNYAYNGTTLYVKDVDDDETNFSGDNGFKTPVDDPDGDDGQGVAPADLTADFFTRGAGASGLPWSSEIWDFDFADADRSWKLPVIKGYREAEQKALCLPAHLRTDPSYTITFPHCS
jgi:hypothetical protein